MHGERMLTMIRITRKKKEKLKERRHEAEKKII